MEFNSDSARSDVSMGLTASEVKRQLMTSPSSTAEPRRRRTSTECSEDSGVVAREVITFQECLQRKAKPSNVVAEMNLDFGTNSILGRVSIFLSSLFS